MGAGRLKISWKSTIHLPRKVAADDVIEVLPESGYYTAPQQVPEFRICKSDNFRNEHRRSGPVEIDFWANPNGARIKLLALSSPENSLGGISISNSLSVDWLVIGQAQKKLWALLNRSFETTTVGRIL